MGLITARPAVVMSYQDSPDHPGVAFIGGFDVLLDGRRMPGYFIGVAADGRMYRIHDGSVALVAGGPVPMPGRGR
jgi:hypothetical protein